MPPIKKHNRKRGFTLMEILVTISLVAMVSVAIYKSLSIGIDVWKRNGRYIAEEDVSIFFDKISRDLYNSFYFTGISFEGNSTSFSFPSFVKTLKDSHLRKDNDDVYCDQIGKVGYFFDQTKKQLLRRQANYSQAINNTFGESRVIASSVERVGFHYYYLTKDGEVFSDVVSGTLPLGVELEVAIKDENGERIVSKYISIPLGG